MRCPEISVRSLSFARSEAGFAVPTVLLAVFAAFSIGTVAIVGAVSAQSGASRDLNTKAALGAAEAGVSNALMRYNRIKTSSAADICAPLGGAAAGAGGWCGPVEAAAGTVDRGTYTYWVRPSETELEIVSQGTVGPGTESEATRRVRVEAFSAQSPPQGLTPFSEHSVIGHDYITQAQNSTITANAATNGDITIAQNSVLDCEDGGAQVGQGRNIIGNYTCNPFVQGELILPPVNQGDVATNNDNDRITLAKAGQSGGDTISGNRNRVDWDPVKRTLTLNQNVSITLGGVNYSLCRLETKQNTNIFVVGGHEMRIYFDAPENCPGVGTDQLAMNQNSSLEATGGDPMNLALLFVGSEAYPTSVTLAQNTQAPGPCAQNFVLYAPRTSINLAQNSYICGAIAGKSIAIAQNTRITANSEAAEEFELPNTETQYFLGYAPETFTECAPAVPAGGLPDGDC